MFAVVFEGAVGGENGGVVARWTSPAPLGDRKVQVDVDVGSTPASDRAPAADGLSKQK